MRPPLLLLLAACALSAQAQTLTEFSTRGLPGSEGVVVRVSHPLSWRKVPVDDPQALAELRGPHGAVTGILQVGRGQRQQDMQASCRPERARDMLKAIGDTEPDTRVLEVFARTQEGRPAFELAYEKLAPPEFLRVRSVIVCLKDTRLVVSCGATSTSRIALADIEPLCRQVLGSLRIRED